MCFFLYDRRNGNSKIVLLLFALITLSALYRVYDKIVEDIKKIKTKTEYITQVDKTGKKMSIAIDRLKDDLWDLGKEIKKLKHEIQMNKMDKTGLVDFAYGGRVLSIRNTQTYEPRRFELLGLVKLCGQSYQERKILESSVMPGDCWPIRGREGNAVVELIDDIFVTKVTMEHASRGLLRNSSINSAPKEFTLWGLLDVEDLESGHFFGQFTYDSDGPEVQTFHIQNRSTKMFRIVEFKIHSNHGNPDLTCIYRVRVHGHK